MCGHGGTGRDGRNGGTACGRRHPSAMHFISALLFCGREKKLGKKIYYAAIKKHQLCCPHRKGCKQLRRAARHDREFGHCGSPLRSYGSTRQTISMCAQGAPRTQGVVLLFRNYECDFFIFPDWAPVMYVYFLNKFNSDFRNQK